LNPLKFLVLVTVGICSAHAPGIAVADHAVVSLANCAFLRAKDVWTGSCGPIFDETPVTTVAPVNAITTGTWRRDVRPKVVWAGVLRNEGEPDYPVEIEVYAGGSGVFRSEFGWFAISGFASDESSIRFQMEVSHEIAPGTLDLAILKRADAILSSASVWNRADDRKCPRGAATWSIYCATEQATIEITGGFHHRRPAMQLVRQIVDERSKGRNYDHRLMDYNNDPSTTFADVHSLFLEALHRIPN
jgi:hypothetical protein